MAYKNALSIISVPLSIESMQDLVALTEKLKYKSKTQLSKKLLEEAIKNAKQQQATQESSEQ